MIRQIIVFVFLLSAVCSNAQNWTWMHGSNLAGSIGSYGTMGTAAASNDPGGRHGCVTWTDLNGDLWLFGGEGYSNSSTVCWMNDLWKYNRSTNQWTWMRGSNGPNSNGSFGTIGIAASTNDPPSREFAKGWVDNNGKLWLFGGEKADVANPGSYFRYNDLWKYDPATNQWTWINGSNSSNIISNYGSIGVSAPSNVPGSRSGFAVWTYNGDLWMFGGRGYATIATPGFLNDLWRYNIASNQWTWMGGNNSTGAPGAWGTQGTPSATNIPSGRDFSSFWKDANDNIYIHGGRGAGYFNDLWKYDPVANTWVWLKGPSTPNQVSVYGTQGVSAPANFPGGRFTAASWMDNYGYLWLFGGTAWASNFNQANDLWRYDPCMNEWTFMKGGQVTQLPGNYGTIGVSAATNMPGARFHNTWWTDPQGDFWLLGGEGFDANGTSLDHMNDLWKYNPPIPTFSIGSASGNQLCTGVTATLNANAAPNTTVSWYSSQTSTNVLGTGNSYTTPLLTAVNNASVYSYFAQVTCTLLPKASINITVNPLPQITITAPASVCAGSSFTMQASGVSTYTWNNGSNTANTTATCGPGGYTCTVLGTSSLGCENSNSSTITALALPTISVTPNKTVACSGFNPYHPHTLTVTATGANTYSWNNIAGPATKTMQSTATAIQIWTITGADNNGCTNTYTQALSWIHCENGIEEYTKGKLIFSIYPNPNTGSFKLQQANQVEDKFKISIFNALGQQVFFTETKQSETDFDLNLASGVYIVILESSTGKGTQRLIIQ